MQLRMARGRHARIVAVAGAAALTAACAGSSAIDISWLIEPPPAGAGRHIAVLMRDSGGRPIRGASLTLEGHMSHPGMAPIVAPMTETADGRYEARLPLSMAGEWTLVVSGSLAGGQRVTRERQLEISGAAPPS